MRQSEALAILGSGASVFLTGAPGAGKTYVLNEFIRQARADGASVAVTASTGIAATHINGTTIHSWSGIGLATALTDNLVKTVRTRRKRKLQEADILIIDEVSMLHAWLFDMVDRICRIIRRDERPFGGLQVVLSGDFFQLPPVSVSGRNNDLIAPSAEYLASRERYMRAGLNPEGFVTEAAGGEFSPSAGRPTRLMMRACSKSRRSRTNTSPNPRVRRIWWNGSKRTCWPPNGCVSRRARP